MIVHKQFPVYADDTLGTGVYHSYVITEQKEHKMSGGAFRVFILGEGRSFLFTKRLASLQDSLTYAREEIGRRDRARAERNIRLSKLA